MFSRALSCFFSRCCSLRFSLFSRALPCSFSLCSSLMFRLFASALSRSLSRRTSLLRRLFSRSLSISLSKLLSMFVDLFINRLCVLSYTSSWKLFFVFFSNAVGDATSRQTNAGGSAVGHAISRRKINPGCSTGFKCLISHWLTWRSVRTHGRSVGRTQWRHNQTKFSRTDGFTKISYQWGSARARLRRARSSAISPQTFLA